jgi:CHAT domain-containing protein
MKKNRSTCVFNFFKDGTRPHRRIFQIVSFCVMLAAVFRPATLIAYDRQNEVNFESRNFQTQATEQQQEIRELKPGETIERQAGANDVHAYQIALEAGTAVEINFKREIPFQALAIIPDSQEYSVPGNVIPSGKVIGRVSSLHKRLVVPLVIVAEKTGQYILKMNFIAAGTYSISCGPSHPASERDRKYAAAVQIAAEIRQLTEKGVPLWKSLDKFKQMIALYRELQDKKGIAINLFNAGGFYSERGENLKAIQLLNEAAELFRSLDSATEFAALLGFIGMISTQLGDYQNAINSYSEYLTLSRSIADKDLEAVALHQLGVVYHLLADESKARDFYEQSLSVRRSITPPTANSLNGEAVTLINLGNICRGVEGNEIVVEAFGERTANDRQKALEYYKQSLEIAWRIKTLFPNAPTREAYNLLQIGNTYKELGNYAEALNYLNQAAERYKGPNPRPGQVYVTMALGNLFALKGEYRKSFEYYEQAIALLNAGADPPYHAKYLSIIAKDYLRAGETRKALDLNSEALTLSRAKQQPVVSAAALFEIAQIERELGNFNNSRNGIEEALQVVESLRSRINSQDVRTIYFSTVKRYYDFYVDLLMQAHKSQPEKGFDALALQMSDKARSRSLLDLLTLARIDIKQGVAPELLERERQASERLIEKANQQTRLLLGKHTKEEAEKIKIEVSNLTDQHQAIQVEIRNKSPRYAALTQPTALNAQQIQGLLDSGTVLLEYSLGEKKSYLWVVSADSIKSFDLPGREEIEAQARQIYELLTARNQHPKDETDQRRRARIATAEAEYPKAAENLSRLLLGPAMAEIGSKRLVIVADGALNYLPFSALPAPNNQVNTIQWQPLGVNHEIINLPSASVLALLRQETAGRKSAPKMLAVFADPVFSSNDTRLAKNAVNGKNGKIENLSAKRDLERAAENVGLLTRESAGGSGLPRLAFSRREADSIYNVSAKNLSLKAVDFKASKSEVVNSNIDQYRILHFATHGLLDSQRPELSGIVLSLLDEKGGERDGFLRLQDIYNLKLSADLVVLSACNTALGKDVKGEGLIGLTRGFMYAGAPRLVASLWKVDDAATAELMSIFYRKMLADNLRPAAALRAAQTEMMKQTRWKSPYYWAPFVIQGEWK